MRPKELSTYVRLRRIAKNPWQTLRFQRKQAEGRVHVVQLNGGPYLYLRADRGDFEAFDRIYLQDVYRVARPPVGGWGIVLDVGGHVGLFAARMSRASERVISYEPNASNFDCLTRNVAACLNVEAVCEGVAPDSGPLQLYRPTSERHSELYSRYRESSPELSDRYDLVPAVSLEALFERHRIDVCSLLKLDVGGFEYDILYSAPKPVLDSIERIHTMYHPVAPGHPRMRGQALARYLEERGFSVELTREERGVDRGRIFARRLGF